MAESRRRWTESDWSLSVYSPRYRDCAGCGALEAKVLGGSERDGIVERRLECDCGRRWRQVIH